MICKFECENGGVCPHDDCLRNQTSKVVEANKRACKKYYDSHKEQRKEAVKKWQAEHREHVREYNRIHSKEYVEAHREQRRIYNREYYLKRKASKGLV